MGRKWARKKKWGKKEFVRKMREWVSSGQAEGQWQRKTEVELNRGYLQAQGNVHLSLNKAARVGESPEEICWARRDSNSRPIAPELFFARLRGLASMCT